MKLPQQAGLILTGLALVLVGCESAKETKHEDNPEPPAIKIGPASIPGPIEPSPTPSLPFPGTPEAKELKDAKEAKDAKDAKDAKKDEPKPAEKPAEPKP